MTTIGQPVVFRSSSTRYCAGVITHIVTLTYDLPANHYYQVAQTAGAGAVTLTRITETVL